MDGLHLLALPRLWLALVSPALSPNLSRLTASFIVIKDYLVKVVVLQLFLKRKLAALSLLDFSLALKLTRLSLVKTFRRFALWCTDHQSIIGTF